MSGRNFPGKHFSIGALKQRASVALAGSGSGGGKKKRPASMMNISVVREEEEGGVPSGVKMNLVPLDQAPPAQQHKNWIGKKKKQRAAENFAVSLPCKN